MEVLPPPLAERSERLQADPEFELLIRRHGITSFLAGMFWTQLIMYFIIIKYSDYICCLIIKLN